ncbi:DUF4136 domain-containing protein [Paraferrimonas haliotis]|uniref:DUF4136 domain-containing protein n=1 Tax=Paraferrimonas haliotis TaxID=2013866 RepID=A0AA37TMW3_9GAMM|nr:DUF4136 domain-containing protein [Paraferrimonas haliotis]GLS82395.1 hypothetical protein GCM10007894_03720 [Paraferrimonas haliotis]
MKMKRLMIGATLALTGVLAGCASNNAVVDYDMDYDFSQISSYQWQPSATSDDPLAQDRIEQAVKAALSAKGLSASEQADVRVVTYAKLEERAKKSAFSVGVGGGSYGSSGGVGGSVNVPVGAGTEWHQWIRIDFVQVSDNKLIWRGEASDVWPEGANVVKKDKITRAIVEQIIANYPPKK